MTRNDAFDALAPLGFDSSMGNASSDNAGLHSLASRLHGVPFLSRPSMTRHTVQDPIDSKQLVVLYD
jgi:hypothetical protein